MRWTSAYSAATPVEAPAVPASRRPSAPPAAQPQRRARRCPSTVGTTTPLGRLTDRFVRKRPWLPPAAAIWSSRGRSCCVRVTHFLSTVLLTGEDSGVTTIPDLFQKCVPGQICHGHARSLFSFMF